MEITSSSLVRFSRKSSVSVSVRARKRSVRVRAGAEKKYDAISASIKDSTGKELYKVTDTEINNEQAIVTFIGSQGDVPLMLRKKDETSITGDIMGMFQVEGKRLSKNK